MRDAVVQQIAQRIGREAEARIAEETRHLEIEIALAVQIAEDAEIGDLALPLVEIVAQEVGLAVDNESGVRLQAARIGYFETGRWTRPQSR